MGVGVAVFGVVVEVRMGRRRHHSLHRPLQRQYLVRCLVDRSTHSLSYINIGI